MRYIDLTLPRPEENLALDEALLEAAEAGSGGEVLRFWESLTLFAVLGYSNQAALEVNLASCQKRQIPVLRRVSGGGTVLQGPGCLNYALVLKISRSPELKNITRTNGFILKQHAAALSPLLAGSGQVEVRGHSDMAIQDIKFSGNAQRRRRGHLLFHGTILYDFDLSLIGETLAMPSKQPDYRRARPHEKFIMNFPAEKLRIMGALKKAWNADKRLEAMPEAAARKLADEKYALRDWNYKF